MAKICLITGKKTIVGNKISNSNKKTKRKFYPNLQKHKFWLPNKNIFVKLRITAKALRTIDKTGLVTKITTKKV